MRKFWFTALTVLMVSGEMLAGGYLTNTNQSVAFLRNPARDAIIGIDGAYSNPAGIGFMSKGWHLGVNVQSAYQTRTPTSYFGPEGNYLFANGMVNGVQNPANGIKSFKGKAKAPVVPSFDLARVDDKWSILFHFGVIGGGGKCNFENGLGLFESQVTMLPILMDAVQPGAVTGYSMDTHMQGRQYYFGGQVGLGYKVLDNLNVSAGLRVLYADCNYYGYVRNVGVRTASGQYMPAADFLTAAGLPDFVDLVSDRELNCDQTGWGFTPIIGVDWKINDQWNVAAKYEFKTRMRLKNRSGVNTSGLSEYDDGLKIAADVPAILTAGVEYAPISKLRVNLGTHVYFDKQATQYENKEEYLDGPGWEVLAGAEYDINDRFTVSAGWQTTNYGLGEDSRFISDMSFVTNSNSVGFGTRIRLKKKVYLDISYFKTIYKHYEKKMADYEDIKTTFGSMLQPMQGALTAAGEQLAAVAAQAQAVLQNPASTQAEITAAYAQLGYVQEKQGVLQKEGAALQGIATGLSGFSTAGCNTYHRTNDVFGVGLVIDF